jgi:hypothetical protein
MDTDSRMSTPDSRLAFLGMLYVDKGAGYRGGILVTDGGGKPVEFRCTAPVRPNPVQKTLYGQTLLPHIAVELIGLPLLRSIKEKPWLVVIQDPVFFDVRLHSESALVRLWRQGEQVRLQTSDDQPQTNAVLSCETGKFQPIVYEAHSQFRADTETIAQQLSEMFTRWDLIEPFERINRALAYVHEQKLLEK